MTGNGAPCRASAEDLFSSYYLSGESTVELFVIEVKRTTTVVKRIKASVSENKCLVCTTKPMKKRGMCSQCASVFEYQLTKLKTDREKRNYEAELIKEGKLLAAHEIRGLRASIDNPLVAIAGRVAAF